MTPPARFARPALVIVLAAVPVHLLLALATDLSPDEAYYLSAARRPSALTALVDHPPLLPWMLRLSDRLVALPVELRVRLWPILCSLVLGLACVRMARARGADEGGCAMAAWLGSWSLLPMAGGFVATPDGPALLGCAAVLLWAGAPGGRDARSDAASSLVAGAGALAKVVVLPFACLAVLAAPARSLRARALFLLPTAAVVPLLVPSVRFQLHHAFVQTSPAGWSPLAAAGALAAAALAQLALWSPWPLVRGVRRLASEELGAQPWTRPDRLVVVVITALVVVSAIARGVPPEPNWWAPAALPIVVAAAVSSMDLARPRRVAMLATVLLPTALAITHCVRPWLPIPTSADPTARLHGWSGSTDETDVRSAPGIGPYGLAAERCVYRAMCDEIYSYFECMDHDPSSDCSPGSKH